MNVESKYRILSIILGIVFFLLSVYIALSVLLPIFGVAEIISPFSRIGFILFSTYKFSSLLIPFILLYSAILLIIPGWSTHSKAVLAGMPIYFFTCVLGEHLIYFLIPKITNTAIKDFANASIVLCTGLLILLEVFLSLIIAEKARHKIIKNCDNDDDEFAEDIVGDGYHSVNQNTTIDLQYNKNDIFLKRFIGKPSYLPSASVLTHEQFLKTGIANESEQHESIKSFEKIAADINVDIGGNVIPGKKPDLIDSLVVIETEDIKLDSDIEELEVQEETKSDDNNELLEDNPSTENAADLNGSDTENTEGVFNEHADMDDTEEDDEECIEVSGTEEDISDEEEDSCESGYENESGKNSEPDSIEISAAQPLKPKAEEKVKGYHIPYDLLTKYPGNEYWIIDDSTKAAAIALKNTFAEFSIDIEITGIRKGPVVTMFEVLPPPGIKLGKITALQDNIALRLAAQSVRIVAPIPGKQAVGIEVPNKMRAIVGFRELIETDIPDTKKMGIPVVLGKDVTGEPQTLDLCQTPHLLIAGATGSGKSVCVNSIILSILYNKSPEEVKLLLVDPKIVELKLYNGIGHLLTPVITEPKKALQGLQYCICEMERRYAMLDGMSVRDIKSYNRKIRREKLAAETLPYIVIIIDEFADLMATTGKELEATVSRLCAMSRAVGIHLVLATQRPSTNVITGLIKANIPSRIAFMVASRIDSQIILDNNGAEKLLGRGDMLYVSTATPFPARIQGTFVSDDEVEQVVEHVKTFGEPDYIDDEIFIDDDDYTQGSLFEDESDPLYDEALEIVLAEGKASASYIQRKLKIGYNRAARIVEEMEARGVVGPANGSKPREVL
ncbi:DNA translocase FtsK [Treponema pedis]|uniref:Cell division protein FtsK n=1 Tax=Treponema pedis TaxID=409322 RepID=A0A7S6WPB4_9SPIR|nr:DNA translocase FtsK [Treponema pedis]QOW60825.1 cell division protein FtsK [Treponema pedis]